MRRFVTFFVFCLVIGWLGYPTSGLENRRRDSDEFVGPAKNIRTEVVELSIKSGIPVEGTRRPVSDCSYDESGNLVESVVYKSGGAPFKKYRAAYDATKPRLEESYYDPKGSLDERFISEYDSAARVVETTRYNSKGSIAGKKIYTFDVAGRVVESATLDSKGLVGSRIVSVYEGAGGNSESRIYGSNQRLLYTVKSLRDSKGRATDVGYYEADGTFIMNCLYSYDDKSNIVAETVATGTGKKQWRYDYEFDAEGNWLKRKTLQAVSKPGISEFVPVATLYRSITYYNRAQQLEKQKSPGGAITKEFEEARSSLTAEAITREPPFYPLDAKNKRIYGRVVVLVIVDEFGKVITAQAASSPDKSLSRASEEAALRWKFFPTLKAGRPIMRVVGTLDFNFNP